LTHKSNGRINDMETIGQKLKAAREKQKMTTADVAKAIRAKNDYIVAIEKDEFRKLIASVYARGFVKLYAQYVRLEYAPLLRQFDAETDKSEPLSVSQTPAPQTGKTAPALKKRRLIRINLAGLAAPLRKIKLPDIRHLKVPAIMPVALPAGKWLALIIAAAFLVIILPIFPKPLASADTKVRVPPSCRWVADPPEPYLNIPAAKPQNGQ